MSFFVREVVNDVPVTYNYEVGSYYHVANSHIHYPYPLSTAVDTTDTSATNDTTNTEDEQVMLWF